MVTALDAVILHCKLACHYMPLKAAQAYHDSLIEKFKDADTITFLGINRTTRQMFIRNKVKFEDLDIVTLQRIVKSNYYIMANVPVPRDYLVNLLTDLERDYENGYR